MNVTTSTATPVGRLIREWRERRRLSQLDLSLRAEVSTRHLSYVETGRSRPTPAMILRLSEQLEIPLRERNDLLLAGGFAPMYPAHAMDAPELATVLSAVRQLLDRHPYPALVLDRTWDLIEANDAAAVLLTGASRALLEPPVNVLRLSLHPDGLAPRIGNLAQWRSHLLEQVGRRAEHTGDPRLRELYNELAAYPGGLDPAPPGAVVVPLCLDVGDAELALFSLATSVQTAADVTISELSVELFYPADEASASLLQARKPGGSGSRRSAGSR